jgi:KUP system potassium uptake protein
VVLAVTGCEALYADMGHFGRRPIQYAWLFVALPALMLNYFGQGAALLRNPSQAAIAFFSVIPHWAHLPMVLLATLAAIIASQAVITGVFSMTQQAVQLGQLPRMEIRHTSATDYGQIYVPRMNVFLATGVVLIVLIFKSSGALAAAYGIAVTGVMVIDTFNASIVAGRQWRWDTRLVILLFGAMGASDLRRGFHRHGYLAARTAGAYGKSALRIPALEPVSGARRQKHPARCRVGRLPVVPHRCGAGRLAAQSQAQQGAA